MRKTRCLFVVVMILLCLSSLTARSRADLLENGKIRVAAYNVEFFLDAFDDPYTSDEKHPVKPRKAIEEIAKTIRAINPDVISFEELENEHVLRAMAAEFLPDLKYTYFAVLPTNSDRGQNVGVMSRVPVISLTSHRFLDFTLPGENRTWRYARDLLRVRVQATENHTMDVYVVHLKSKFDSDNDPGSTKWRTAEAVMTKAIIEAEFNRDPQSWYVLMGDFNDTLKSLPITTLLSKNGAGNSILIDVHGELPFEQRLTYRKNPYKQEGPIDYIMASPALFSRLIPKSNYVQPEIAGVTNGSDHLPITAAFDIGK